MSAHEVDTLAIRQRLARAGRCNTEELARRYATDVAALLGLVDDLIQDAREASDNADRWYARMEAAEAALAETGERRAKAAPVVSSLRAAVESEWTAYVEVNAEDARVLVEALDAALAESRVGK